MSPRRAIVVLRRVTLVLALAGMGYLFWRADFVSIPEKGCSPIHGFAPGARVLVDRHPGALHRGDAVLFRGAPGELLLGRIAEPPLDLSVADRAAIDAGALWILTDRVDCPGTDSVELGPITPDRIAARLILAVGW